MSKDIKNSPHKARWKMQIQKPLYFLCLMQNPLEEIEIELVKRINTLYLKKFNGNKSKFAIASGCRESTIRRILNHQQGITINLLLRIAFALDIEITDLLNGLSIKKEG